MATKSKKARKPGKNMRAGYTYNKTNPLRPGLWVRLDEVSWQQLKAAAQADLRADSAMARVLIVEALASRQAKVGVGEEVA